MLRTFASTNLLFLTVVDSSEEIHASGKHQQQNTSSRTKTQHLGHESLVKSAKALLSEHGKHRGQGPVVLGDDTGDSGGVLDSGLDHIKGGVEHGTGGSSNRSGNQIVDHLASLVSGLGQQLSHLENDSKVTRVPGNVSPQSGLQTVVQSERTLLSHNGLHHVGHAGVLGRLVLESDLNELKGHDDERLGGSGGGSGQNRQRLGHLGHAKGVSVELAPLVVGSKLDGSLGGLHENGGGNTSVQSREALVSHNLLETVDHGGVLLTSALDLELHSGLDHVQGVHDQDFGHAGNGSGCELVDEGEGWVSDERRKRQNLQTWSAQHDEIGTTTQPPLSECVAR